LSNIIITIVNEIYFNITGAPQGEIDSSKLGTSYADYTLFDLLVPGIMIGSLSICLSLLAIAIGREKESRRIHRLLTTPVEKNTIIMSFIIAQIISAIIQFFIAVILSHLLATHGFSRANWFYIFFIAMLYNLTSMGIGLILGSFVSSGRNAAIISFIITFTMMMIGENYSVPGEMAGSAFIPNTYAVDAVRNILLFGKTGWDAIGFDIIFLTAFGLVSLTIGLISFNRKYVMVSK
jgi:ABC-type multidrug transport system permease subunit